jgi:hypothetical protein
VPLGVWPEDRKEVKQDDMSATNAIRNFIDDFQEEHGEKPPEIRVERFIWDKFREEVARANKVELENVPQMHLKFMDVSIFPGDLKWGEA